MFKKIAQLIAAEIKAEFVRLIEAEFAASEAPALPAPSAPAAADPPAEG